VTRIIPYLDVHKTSKSSIVRRDCSHSTISRADNFQTRGRGIFRWGRPNFNFFKKYSESAWTRREGV